MWGAALTSRRWRLFFVAAFAAATAFAGVFTLPPLDRDEARFAQATVQMLESGDFIAIRFQDDERNKKPAGIHWLQAASVSLFSAPEARAIWAYRLPSVLGAVLAAVFTYLAGARAYDDRTGFIAALLLASAPVVAAEATIAKTDAMLLALVCLAQLTLLHVYARQQESRGGGGFSFLFWVAQGAATLVKGPIAAMIAIATVAGLATARPRFAWLKGLRPIAGAAILAAIVLPWLWAVNEATDGRFVSEAIGRDMLGKIGEAQESHAGPPGYHLALVWLLFWPAAALIPPGLALALKERGDWRARFFLAWLIPAWIVFELAGTKLPHYVMPLYPALAVIAARAALSPDAQRFRRTGAVIYAVAGAAAASIIAALTIAYGGGVSAFAVAGAVAAASLVIAFHFWRGRAARGALGAACLSAVFAWIVLAGVLPRAEPLDVSRRLSTTLDRLDLHPIRDGAAPVAIAGYNEPSAVFLLGTQTALTTPAAAADRLLSRAAGAAIIEAAQQAAFLAALNGAAAEPLATIDGVNYSNGRNVSLTIYALGQDR